MSVSAVLGHTGGKFVPERSAEVVDFALRDAVPCASRRCNKFAYVARVELCYSPVQNEPQILNWIQIWRVRRPGG